MTELELYKFLEDYNIEYHWENENNDFLAWIPFYHLADFTELIGINYLTDNSTMCNLQDNCICIDLVPIAEYHDIDLENILRKDYI